MSRLQTVRENWTDITTKLLRDKQELANFLRFSASMYKQSFSDAVLIYQQNPNATKVATLETWNKLGRIVNKGEHSIAVFGEDSKSKHLFDISQTNGKRVPELWKLTEDLSADLTAVINEKYGKDCKNIQETIAAVAVDNIKSRLPDMQYAVGQMRLSEKPVEYYAVHQTLDRKFAVATISADGLVTDAKSGIATVAEAKKAMFDIFKSKQSTVKCELVHPQTLDEKSSEIYRSQTKELPAVTYRITPNPDKKSPDTHILQEYVKNSDDTYAVGKVMAKGDYEKCNSRLANLINPPQIEAPCQDF